MIPCESTARRSAHTKARDDLASAHNLNSLHVF
jgi:hypothetical protein